MFYNFLRKIAGSYENVLISENGTIHSGSYHVMPNGTIMTGATHEESTSKPLTLKEYKYFVHEISPSRREVRLAPQRINDSKYIYKNSWIYIFKSPCLFRHTFFYGKLF